MADSSFVEIVKVFSKLYSEEKIEVRWRRNSAGLHSTVHLENELSKNNLKVTEEEFINNVFEIIKLSRLIALGEKIAEDDEEKSLIIKEHFLNKQSIRDFILVHSTSNLNVLEKVDYELLTKRSKENPKKILSHTTVINLYTSKADSDKESSDNRLSIELSKEELIGLINNLQDILETLKQIDN